MSEEGTHVRLVAAGDHHVRKHWYVCDMGKISPFSPNRQRITHFYNFKVPKHPLSGPKML